MSVKFVPCRLSRKAVFERLKAELLGQPVNDGTEAPLIAIEGFNKSRPHKVTVIWDGLEGLEPDLRDETIREALAETVCRNAGYIPNVTAATREEAKQRNIPIPE